MQSASDNHEWLAFIGNSPAVRYSNGSFPAKGTIPLMVWRPQRPIPPDVAGATPESRQCRDDGHRGQRDGDAAELRPSGPRKPAGRSPHEPRSQPFKDLQSIRRGVQPLHSQSEPTTRRSPVRYAKTDWLLRGQFQRAHVGRLALDDLDVGDLRLHSVAVLAVELRCDRVDRRLVGV